MESIVAGGIVVRPAHLKHTYTHTQKKTHVQNIHGGHWVQYFQWKTLWCHLLSDNVGIS